MKARKAAKVIKRDLNIDKLHHKEWAYLVRITRRMYVRKAATYRAKGNLMMSKAYVHLACSPYMYEEVAYLWNIIL